MSRTPFRFGGQRIRVRRKALSPVAAKPMLARMNCRGLLLALALSHASAYAQSNDALQQTLVAKANDFHLSHQHLDQNLLFKSTSPDLLFVAHTGRYSLEDMFAPDSAQAPCLLGSFKVTEP